MPISQEKAKSANSEADVADGFAAEALLQFPQDFGLGDLFELVVQCGLKNADVENSFAQCNRRGMRGDEVADDFGRELARNLDLPLARATKELSS